MDADDDEPEDGLGGPHESALIAFAVSFGFAKRLVQAQGADGFRPQAAAEIRNWMALQIEGAQAYLDAGEGEDGATPELMALARTIAEARAWLDTLP